MKSKKELKEHRSKSNIQLYKELENLNKKLSQFSDQKQLGKLKKFSDIQKTKKRIAKIKTIIRENVEKELEKDLKSNKD